MFRTLVYQLKYFLTCNVTQLHYHNDPVLLSWRCRSRRHNWFWLNLIFIYPKHYRPGWCDIIMWECCPDSQWHPGHLVSLCHLPLNMNLDIVIKGYLVSSSSAAKFELFPLSILYYLPVIDMNSHLVVWMFSWFFLFHQNVDCTVYLASMLYTWQFQSNPTLSLYFNLKF